MGIRSFALTFLGLLCGVVGTAYAQSSTFQLSCENIQLTVDQGGVRITANCRAMSGAWFYSEYQIPGIDNEDGRLRNRGYGPSSFQKSCRDIGLHWDDGKVELAAICRTIGGKERKTRTEIQNVGNFDGKLDAF
jgi:hypothetical protein